MTRRYLRVGALPLLCLQLLLLGLLYLYISTPTGTAVSKQAFFINASNIIYPNNTIISNWSNLHAKVPRLNNKLLPRVLDQKQYNELMHLIRDVAEVFTERNFSYVLTYGSLLGSYVMHDQLPWDDDVDIFANNNSKAAILNHFRYCKPRGICGYNHIKNDGMMIKLYYKNGTKATKYPWTWPYIDLVFYEVKNQKVRAVDRSSKLTVPADSFFPFHYRPLGPLWLPAPHQPWVLLKAKYKSFQCLKASWNHRQEKRGEKILQSCSKLLSDYPFVKRSRLGSCSTVESLMLDNKVLYNVYINETYRHQKSLNSF